MLDCLFSLAAGLAFLNYSCPFDELSALQIYIYIYLCYSCVYMFVCICAYNRFVSLSLPVDDRY